MYHEGCAASHAAVHVKQLLQGTTSSAILFVRYIEEISPAAGIHGVIGMFRQEHALPGTAHTLDHMLYFDSSRGGLWTKPTKCSKVSL